MSNTEYKIGKLIIRNSPLGIDIQIPKCVDSSSYIDVSVRQEGINIAATGTLNQAGQKALEDGVTLAKLIRKYKYGKID